MSDFPSPPAPLFVPSASLNSAFSAARTFAAASSGGALTWVANLAIYMPIMLPWAYPVNRVFWLNGSTLTTSSADFGIYSADGTRIYSTGSTTMSGTTAPQYVTPSTPFILSPGAYYFGWACNNTTNRAYGSTPSQSINLRLAGMLQESSAFPLPATMTPAAISNALYPFCGITRTASGF